MERTNDVYERLRPPEPAEDVCSCPGEPPIKLMTIRDVRGFNPIHCLDCNLEVPPERLAIDRRLVEAIASWDMEQARSMRSSVRPGPTRSGRNHGSSTRRALRTWKPASSPYG